MRAPKRTAWTVLLLIAFSAATAPAWRYLWDLQQHDLRIGLGIYAIAVVGALITSFDVFVHTREGGPSYEPMWPVAWPLWSVVGLAVIAALLTGEGGIYVLGLASVPIGLLAIGYRVRSNALRQRFRDTVDSAEETTPVTLLGRSGFH